MVRERDGFLPIGEASGSLDGPGQAIRKTPLPARHSFTVADQVDQLGRGQRSGPRSRFYGADAGAVLVTAHQPRRPDSV